MSESGIPYIDKALNLVTGCTPAGEGCLNCYAARLAATRLKHLPQYAGLAEKTPDGYRWTGEVREHRDLLTRIYYAPAGNRIGLCFMSDLFHPHVSWAFILTVLAFVADNSRATFVLTTKRPERFAEFADRLNIPNLHLGVSCSNQAEVDRMVPLLLKVNCGVRWVSLEPLLGPVDLTKYIGYNPMYETNKQRECDTSGGPHGAVSDQQRWNDMEDCRTEGQQVEREGCTSAHSSKKGGAPHGILLASEVHDGGETGSLPGTQGCMDSLQRRDTGRLVDKPHQRRQTGQQVGESRACDPEPERETRALGRNEDARRAEKPQLETNRLPGGCHTSNVRDRIQDSVADSRAIWSSPSNHIENSEGNSQEDTTRTNGGLHTAAEERRGKEGSEDRKVQHVIVGGESGPNARPMHPDWVRSIRDQCQEAGVAFYMKQMAGREPIPADLQIRQMPEAQR